MVLHQMSTSSDQLYLRCRWEVLISGPDPLCKMVALSFLELGKQERFRIIDGNVAFWGVFRKTEEWFSVKFPHAIYCTLREPGTLKSSKCSFQDVWSSAQVRDSCKYAFFKGSWGDWHHQLVVGLHFENMNLSLGNELRNTKNRLPGSTGAKFQA